MRKPVAPPAPAEPVTKKDLEDVAKSNRNKIGWFIVVAVLLATRHPLGIAGAFLVGYAIWQTWD